MTDDSLLEKETEIRLSESATGRIDSTQLAQTVGGENLTPVVSGELSKGTVIGHYEILDVVGKGSMGCVYKALDRALNRIVAIKTLTRQMNEENVLRFQEEARALSRLNHPHIATIYQIDVTSEHVPYIVMEYVEGQTLAEVIAADFPLNPDWIGWMVGQIGGALSAVHKAGILHRDLKPSNIVVATGSDGFEKIKIIDFGIAFDESREQRLTRKGVTIGTPLYMSPEQIAGEDLSPATDLYSMGCVVYDMLEGKPPYQGTKDEVLASHMRGQAPQLSKRYRYLQPLISSSLHNDPAKRPIDADVFAREFITKIVFQVPRMLLTTPASFFDRAGISRKSPGREVYMPMARMWASMLAFAILCPLTSIFVPKPYGAIVVGLLFMFVLLFIYLAMRKVSSPRVGMKNKPLEKNSSNPVEKIIQKKDS